MLKIYTDLPDHQWLTYILEEFKRISGAKFNIQVDKFDEASNAEENALYYTEMAQHNKAIYQRASFDYGDMMELSQGEFAFKNTLAPSKTYLLSYDLFWNAFIVLSRHEEYASEEEGKRIRSYRSRHPRKLKHSFDIPLVNIYFRKLEETISKLFPELTFDKSQNKTIELSHDVDYINKTAQLIFKQSAFNIFNLFKSIFGPGNFFKLLGKTLRFPFSRPSYFCFDYWKDLEMQKGIHSVFYVYAKTPDKGFKSWLIDPSYNVGKNKKLQKKLKELTLNGFEIGLHGSLNSAVDFESLKNQKTVLEEAIFRKVTRSRQHWLNYSELKTPSYHNELFELDSTLGWNDAMGFRSGCASKYKPWDHVNNQAFSYFVVPQILMDSTIFDYSNPEEAKKKAFAMLKNLEDFKNVYVSISWHQRTCSSDYKWHYLYKQIIHEYL